MTDTPEPPPHSEPPPPPVPPPAVPSAAPWRSLPIVPILAVVAVILVLAVAALALRGFSGGPPEEAYTVEPFTPQTEMVTGVDRVTAYAEPDGNSAAVVMFGQGVTLNVTGRVSRGLGGDWYAISWNDRTAYVRLQDAIAGSGAPPAPDVRERPEEEEILEEEKDKDPFADEEEEIAEAPPVRSTGGLGVGDVNWIREPSARDFARYFPDRALDDSQSGRVTLDCTIGGGGRLDCSVVSESPTGYGFGRAAMNISRQVRVDPTLPDGSSAEGRRLSLPLSFRAG
jgi:periplasmic protein TonB